MTFLCSCVHQGMIQQLIDYNLRHGALSVRLEVRSLLCLLTRDNRRATEEMNNLIMTRITAAVKGHQSNPDMVSLPVCPAYLPLCFVVVVFVCVCVCVCVPACACVCDHHCSIFKP